MKGTAAEGRVLAKTGTTGLANALAGFVTTQRGERLAFAIVVNNHAGKSRRGGRGHRRGGRGARLGPLIRSAD